MHEQEKIRMANLTNDDLRNQLRVLRDEYNDLQIMYRDVLEKLKIAKAYFAKTKDQQILEELKLKNAEEVVAERERVKAEYLRELAEQRRITEENKKKFTWPSEALTTMEVCELAGIKITQLRSWLYNEKIMWPDKTPQGDFYWMPEVVESVLEFKDFKNRKKESR